MIRDFEYFIKCLNKAAKCIGSHYFQLQIAGAPVPKPRERVYCYEMYHQIRCVIGKKFPYELDGEVDKRAHPYIEPLIGAVIPDFIVHVPGTMERNLIVIEVKPVKTATSALQVDVAKLGLFIKKAHYFRGIMLIFGNLNGKLPKRILELREEIKDCSNEIIFLWHSAPGRQLTMI